MIDSKELYTYKEVCELLNIPFLKGNSQIKQLRELLVLCDYEKQGHKYDFIRLRSDTEMISYDNRTSYAPYIEYWLSDAFSKNKFRDKLSNGVMFISMRDLLVDSGMVNGNFRYLQGDYNEGKRRYIAFKHKEEFSYYDLNVFTDKAYREILKPIVRNAMISMDNRGSIKIERGYRMYRFNADHSYEIKQFTVVSKDGQKILSITNRALAFVGVDKISELYFKRQDKLEEYYAECRRLCKEELGYDGFYDCYAIVADENKIQYNIELLKKTLNCKIIERFENAKQLDKVSSGGRRALIDALIDIDSDYDFEKEIREHYEKD
jgi:hypothetical protein